MTNENNGYYTSSSLYLKNKKGNEITKIQNKINNSSDSFIVATQIFPTIMDNSTQHYDCFIYIKTKSGKICIFNENTMELLK